MTLVYIIGSVIDIELINTLQVNSAPKDILLLPLARHKLHCQSLVPLAGDSCLFPENPGTGESL